MKKTNPSLFLTIVLSFSAVLLVFTLLCSVEMAKFSAEAGRLEEAIQTAEKENRVLEVRLMNRLSLEELERYATEKLGMRPPSERQIYYIDVGQAG